VGRAVAPAASVLRSKTAGEESPSRTGQWVPAFGGVLTVWLTATGGNPRESATENTQPMAPPPCFITKARMGMETGNGEMVR
jgi:hypothetical protein